MEGIVGRFLSFEKMMAGSIIKIAYYILLVFVILGGIVSSFTALMNGQIGLFLMTIVGTLLGILFVRIICEMYIVIFRISDNLTALRKMKEEGK
ncbi:MAG: DUF4282 domain-containing protein [Pseudomonadota bacterium]